MRYTSTAAIVIALAALSLSPASGQVSGLSIPPTGSSYLLANQTFVTRSQSYYTYQAILVNTGAALASVTATATSLSPNVTVVAGQGTLHFSSVPANGQAISTNSFTILVSGGVSFDGSQISWSFNGPVANPGPNQTVPVLSTVTLNGGGSTNPSGIGSLTYSWAIQSAPSGSTAALSNANSAIATFMPDLLGTYVIALTVNNGSQTDANTVTISTTDVPPTANAGSNQTMAVGSSVTLNGTKSSDVNNQPLSYSWSLLSVPNGSSAFLSAVRSPNPSFTVDKAGSYIAGLIVNDGTLSSSQSTVTITTGNTPPVAVATAMPQIAVVNGLVQLDGSKSTDVDGNPLTYAWSLNTSQAPNSNAVLSNPNIVNPVFTADVAGTYVAQLIVSDGTIASQPVTVTITTNAVLAPTANPGSSQTVSVGSIVQLHGSGTDPQNFPLTYTWSLLTVPPGSAASLSATNIQNPTFIADLPGTYSAQLVVNDGHLSSNSASVTISSTSIPPIAVPSTATPSVPLGSAVSLSGSSSVDPANLPITGYSWSLSVPNGSTATLIGANTEFPTFVPDVAGTYVAQLIVQDRLASSIPATVSISAGTMTISLSPNPLNLPNTPEPLTITLSPGAGASPVAVTLSGYDPNVISPQSNTVTIPANSAAANVSVNPLTQGSTSITASAPGYQSNNVSVLVETPTLAFTFDNSATSVALGQSIGATITLSAPAPQPSGSSVTFIDIQDHDSGNMPGLVTFNVPMIVIPPGSTTGRITITGAELGPIEIQVGSAGYQRLNFIVFNVVPQGGVTIPNNLSVPAGQSVPLNVQLSSPAPAGGATITLQSNNTGILTVSPTTVTVGAGTTAPAIAPQITGVMLGSTNITGSSSGYSSVTATVNVTSTLTLSPANVSLAVGGQQSVSVNLSAPAPAGGLPVTLTSSSGNATVTANVTISVGQLTAPAQINGVSAGPATITATVSNPLVSTTGASISVLVATLAVPCPAVTTGDVNTPFNTQVTATSGTAPYTYSIVGTLPSGLTLNVNTGAVSGTPTASGSFSVKVTDSTGASGISCPITINPQLLVTCPAVTTGDVNAPFNTQVPFTGGTAPYTFSIVGTLPSGLTLNASSGAVSGTPMAPGSFFVKVTDAAGAAGTTCPIIINSSLSVACAATTSGVVGTAFNSGPLAVTGGTAPYAYSIIGTLPSGLTLNASSGAASGTPMASGSFSVQVKDATGVAATVSCPITITGPPSLTCPSSNSFHVGTPVNSPAPPIGGGTAPYTFSLASGTLPSGLSLNTSTGAITGTPTATGAFTLQVKDTNGIAAAATCPFTVGPAANLTITSASLPQGTVGAPYSFQPLTSGGTLPFVWTITGLPRSFTYDATSGLISGTGSSGTYTVAISVSDSGSPQESASTTLTLAIGSTSLAIATTSPLPGATVDMLYVAQLSASGGQTPYHWSASNIPAWLTFDVSGSICGAPVSVCGTPTASFSGLNTFTVTLVDSTSPVVQAVTQSFSLTVTAQGRTGR
jgi:hypothetical protein